MQTLMRLKFWVGIAVIVIVAVVLFVVGPLSAMGRNDEQFETLEERADDLQRYVDQKVKNEKWQEQQSRVQRQMERQLRQMQEELLSRDALLEKHLKDPDTGAAGPLSFGRFPTAYNQKMSELRTTLEDSVIKLGSDQPLVQESLGSEWQPQPVLHAFEKQLWIQEAIVNAVADVNSGATVVPVFTSFTFRDQPLRLLSPAHREKFDTIPFELKVAMEFEFYPLFLERLMEIPLGPEITATNITRYTEGTGSGREDRRVPSRSRRDRTDTRRFERPEEGYGSRGMERRSVEEERDSLETEEEQEPLPNDLVSVTINGYIPDYKAPEEESVEESPEAPE